MNHTSFLLFIMIQALYSGLGHGFGPGIGTGAEVRIYYSGGSFVESDGLSRIYDCA